MNKSDKCSFTQIGRIVIHLGDKELRVYKDELSQYLEMGYEIGISDKHRKELIEKHLGKTPSNKGCKMSPETYEKVKNSGTWFQTGKDPWNKGLTKEVDERVLKYSKPLSEEAKLNLSEKRKGFKFSEETKEKMSKSHLGKNLGKRDPEVGKKISKAKKGCLQSEETKRKISLTKTGVKLSREAKEVKLRKEYETKKKNNSFNTSKPEKQLLEKLKLENPGKTILTQYKDELRYPYYCDFYIVEDDLFIELNAHWTHGGKPYDPDDIECQEQLKIWQEKAKQSDFYKQAIYNWTVRDVAKMKCAKDNNLNYKVIYEK